MGTKSLQFMRGCRLRERDAGVSPAYPIEALCFARRLYAPSPPTLSALCVIGCDGCDGKILNLSSFIYFFVSISFAASQAGR